MLNIVEVNNSIIKAIDDSSEENLKEAISQLSKAVCKSKYLQSPSVQELYDIDIWLYTVVIGEFVPATYHNRCYHHISDELPLIAPNKFEKVMSIFRAYESIYQWCMHLLYTINDKPMFNKARHRR